MFHKSYKFFILFFLIITTGVFFMFNTANSTLVNAQTHTLKNGLKIVILPSGVAPVATIGVLVHVGTADDPVDQVGLSHFMEHMMFKGTILVPSNQFKKKILRLGGETNALTEYDYTLFYTTVSKNHIASILELEADRLANLAFTREEVESEKKVVLEERNMRIENNPMGSLYERYLQARNPYHPYGVLPIGFPHHIKKYSYDSVREHYRQWYQPHNVTLLISGQVTLEEVLPLIEKYFSALPSQDVPQRLRVSNPPRDGVTQTIVQHKKKNSLVIAMVSYDAPHYHKMEDKKMFYALSVLAQILGGDTATDFSQTLIEKQKLALHVASDYDGISRDEKDFSITAVLTPDSKIEALTKVMEDYLKAIREKGVDDAELEHAKNLCLGRVYELKDGSMSYLCAVAELLGKGHSHELLNDDIEGIRTVTNGDIQKAAHLVFGKAPVVKVELYPA